MEDKVRDEIREVAYLAQNNPDFGNKEIDTATAQIMALIEGVPEKYVHYAIQVEPNNTIGLYKDGKSVKSIDFWILDGRGSHGRHTERP